MQPEATNNRRLYENYATIMHSKFKHKHTNTGWQRIVARSAQTTGFQVYSANWLYFCRGFLARLMVPPPLQATF